MEISELHLKTHDLDAVYEFYVEQLDFDVINEREDRITLDAGATRLIFQAPDDDSDDDDEDRRYLYHFAFNIPGNQLTDARRWLAMHIDLLEHDGRQVIDWPAWDAQALYLRDPVGNVVEFIARYQLDNDSSIPFSAQSVLGVSEIGLAVDNVQDASRQLQEKLSLPVWDEGSETFQALGDANGLVILVKNGRPWFPTIDARAVSAPVTLTIRGDRHETVQLNDGAYTIQMRAGS